MSVVIKLGYKYKMKVGKLFEEYTQMLINKDANFAKYLKLQNYELL